VSRGVSSSSTSSKTFSTGRRFGSATDSRDFPRALNPEPIVSSWASALSNPNERVTAIVQTTRTNVYDIAASILPATKIPSVRYNSGRVATIIGKFKIDTFVKTGKIIATGKLIAF
jgi:hypothetical protein